MLSSVIHLGLTTLSLATYALAASPALTVSIVPLSKSVKSIDDLKLAAIVSNPTAKDVRVLKYGTVLDNLPTRSFAITKDNKDVSFIGIRVGAVLFFRLHSIHVLIHRSAWTPAAMTPT